MEERWRGQMQAGAMNITGELRGLATDVGPPGVFV